MSPYIGLMTNSRKMRFQVDTWDKLIHRAMNNGWQPRQVDHFFTPSIRCGWIALNWEFLANEAFPWMTEANLECMDLEFFELDEIKSKTTEQILEHLNTGLHAEMVSESARWLPTATNLCARTHRNLDCDWYVLSRSDCLNLARTWWGYEVCLSLHSWGWLIPLSERWRKCWGMRLLQQFIELKVKSQAALIQRQAEPVSQSWTADISCLLSLIEFLQQSSEEGVIVDLSGNCCYSL